jgi:hypothetical protein
MTDTTYPTWADDPTIHGYWVIRDQLLAGEYPGSPHEEKATRKIGVLTAAGVTSFVDLTEAGEPAGGGQPMKPYDHLLPDGISYRRFPIPDNGVIGHDGYDAILAHIRAEIAGGQVVFVHCWGGKGRTGTVVGAWLIEDGADYPDVLDLMHELRRGTKKAYERVPETSEQRAVLNRRAHAKAVGR